MILVQRINKRYGSEQEMMEKYFSVIAVLNSLHLSPAQITLLAFIARKGTISSGGAKSEFCEMTGFPKASLGNLISQLTKEKEVEFQWLVKQDDRIIINPLIRITSCMGMALKIHLNAD